MDREGWLRAVRSLTKGTIYIANFYRNGDDFSIGQWREWDVSSPLPPSINFDHRTVLPNEVVFDIDEKDWREVRNIALLIHNFLNLNSIPHVMGQSGGKGIHIHIFLKLSPDIYKELSRYESSNIDIPRLIRLIFFKWVIENTGVKESSLDPSLVKWSSEGKGHMVREFGGRKFVKTESGIEIHYKSYLSEIPKDRVWADEKDVQYPPALEVYRIEAGRFSEYMLKMIEGEIEKLSRVQEIDIDKEFPNMEYLKLPCIKRMLTQKIPEGKRNRAGKVLSAVCLKKSSIEKCEKLLEDWHRKFYAETDFRFREIEDWLKSLSKKGKDELFFSCSENLEIIGEGWSFCSDNLCPVYYRKRSKWRAEKNIEKLNNLVLKGVI